jgi:hypothetical protein
MFPRTLLAGDGTSPGEAKVFAALRDGLDRSWDVFHSVGILRGEPGGEAARDAEVDFVLAHPEHGVVCLEVKGGDIECRHGEWLRRIDGTMRRVTDPFAQVTAQHYALRDLLHERTGLAKQRLKLARGVVLADVPVHALVLGTDAPPEIVIDRHGVQDIAAAVHRVVAFAAGARDLRVAPDQEVVRDLLAPTFKIRVPMAEAFLAEERQLVELTREQSIALRRLARNHRMAVYGCAGSGKTMLAVEHARRLADAGQDVLFVCFNRQLAAHLELTAKHDRIRYSTFHRLCVAQARRAELDLPDFGTSLLRPSTGSTCFRRSSSRPSTSSGPGSTPSSSTKLRTSTTTGSTLSDTGCGTRSTRRCGSSSTTTSGSTTPSSRFPPASSSTSSGRTAGRPRPSTASC